MSNNSGTIKPAALSVNWDMITVLELFYLANEHENIFIDGDLKTVMFK
jgi:hypothetical protein